MGGVSHLSLLMATHDRTAAFRLEGAIAARTAEAGQRTAQALQRICRVRSRPAGA